jgi:hypothetical protein
VDKVEAISVPGPRFGAVVDLEGDVGWHPCGLDGGEVGADDGDVRVLVGKVTERSVVPGGGLVGCSHGPNA